MGFANGDYQRVRFVEETDLGCSGFGREGSANQIGELFIAFAARDWECQAVALGDAAQILVHDWHGVV